MQITRIPAKRENKKMKVAVYCRVSTKMDTQENSLETQQEGYIKLISLRTDWELEGVYSDSLSGLRAEKRPGFMKMIKAAMNGKIDRILCKSVSRFSRNVAECKKYTDMLRSRNVTVEFEKERLRTDDPTSSFIFSLMSAIAENESRSISENIRWGYKERFKRGEFNLGNNRILGYDTVDGKLVANQYADSVRLIFALFLQGKTVEEIIRTLTDIGVKTRNNTPLSRYSILYILKNETYKGDKLLQKQPPKDFISKKPDTSIMFESNYLENDHEAIVSRDVWDAVQAKLEENKKIGEKVGHRGGQPHFLYGKIFCGECGAPMTRRTVYGPGGEKIKTWICREKRKKNGCKCRNVKEEYLLKYGDAKRIVIKSDGVEVD
jgi:DNA invertase Pin-like site-specific DNA recombinase